jgi:PPOX class probable F420-dependent enzyme
MERAEAIRRFASAPVARLATTGADGRPHLVPITFAVLDGGQTIVTAVDHKPKRTRALRRLANIAVNPSVTVLVDHYDADWSALWWVRADGRADVRPGGQTPAALSALAARYPQYSERLPSGPLIVISVTVWSGWAAS